METAPKWWKTDIVSHSLQSNKYGMLIVADFVAFLRTSRSITKLPWLSSLPILTGPVGFDDGHFK